MSENELTTFLFKNLQNGGIKKLTKKLADSWSVQLSREIGDSSCIADIFIALDSKQNKKKYIAIEVKIKDWQSGLYQAWRYNNFADKSYLAIYSDFEHRIDINDFKDANVGLISFDEDTIKILHHPKINRFSNNSFAKERRDKLWNTFSKSQKVSPYFQESFA